MKIVIAPDSFKESLTAEQVCAAVERGFRAVLPDAEYCRIPMADGGEGTTEALLSACGGERVCLPVADPLGRTVEAAYARLPDGTAVMEMAQAAGLHLLLPHERNPLHTSTFGVGQMLRHALENGARRIILGIGGSATNDGGAGMAQALGFRLLDENGAELPRGGAALRRLAAIDTSGSLPALRECRLSAACDVDNPLCGERGASAVFAPQKGADAAMVAELDAALTHFADVAARQYGGDRRDEAGSGAAGGLGFGLRVLLGADLCAGVELVMAANGLADKIAGADLVVTGEGRMDGQTLFGKVPLGVLRAAQAYGVPVLGLAGSVGQGAEALNEHGFAAVLPCIDRAADLPDLLVRAAWNIERTARQAAGLWASAR